MATGRTSLKLGAGRPARVVDGLLTGFHEPDTSHFELESAIIERPQLDKAFMFAQREGFLGHEFGDVLLLLKR